MKKVAIWIIATVICFACNKDSNNIIPNVSFTATVNIVPQYSGKSLFMIMPGSTNRIVGVNGVVVWNNGGDQFYAFDRMCTHKHDDGRVYFVEKIEDGNPIVRCPQCKSEFLVATEYGDIIKDPAIYPLKPYATTYRNGQLTIRNN
ncbi:MAG: Rieske 2Fe-2S domain-containing protein [Carboxylicivirga sp.]|nr:Rieske 2Fe-2S domain-containing protein [Carboxylicivirga sp.]